MKEKKCLKSRPVEDPGNPQGSIRSRRGAQLEGQTVHAPKPKPQSRANLQLERDRQSQIPAQPSTQGGSDLQTIRNDAQYDSRSQAYGNQGNCATGAPSTSSAPPRPLATPLHLTPAYFQAHSLSVSATQSGHASHPIYHAPPTPDFFPAGISQSNFGGTYANVITNNHHVHNTTTEDFRPTSIPQFTNRPQQFPVEFGVPTYTQSHFDLRTTTRSQDPGQSTSNAAYYAANPCDGYPSQDAHQYEAQTRGPEAPRRNQGGGRAGKRPCTSMSSGRTPVAPCEALSTLTDLFPCRFTDECTRCHEYRNSPPVLRGPSKTSMRRSSRHWCRLAPLRRTVRACAMLVRRALYHCIKTSKSHCIGFRIAFFFVLACVYIYRSWLRCNVAVVYCLY